MVKGTVRRWPSGRGGVQAGWKGGVDGVAGSCRYRYAGCEIIRSEPSVTNVLRRFPHGKRRLRSLEQQFALLILQSLPSREAWVEILMSIVALPCVGSLPSREAWVAMFGSISSFLANSVASLPGSGG